MGGEGARLPSLATLFRQAWSGRYTAHGDVSEADCVIGFAFGYEQDAHGVQPGVSNEDLAGYLRDHLPGLPRVLQVEVAEARARLAPADAAPQFIIRQHRRAGVHLDTREVAEQALAILEQHGWRQAVVLAHPNHLPRSDVVCRKLGIATVLPPGLERVRFGPRSVQKWTRNRFAWMRREAGALLYYRWQGWI